MPKDSRVHTIRLPLRKICAVLPAVALISGGVVFSASAAPTALNQAQAASSNAPAIVVPAIPMTLPGSARLAEPFPLPAPKGPSPAPTQPLVSMLPAGTTPGSSSLVTLDSTGIPVRALDGYRKAASLVGSADPTCHIDWALLAAIGRVESDHGRFGGNQLDSAGVARPGIIGIALDGSNGTARITDTDHGVLDRDTTYDRAVGPMQFIPSTWRVAGVDANGDGVKNPQDIADAAAATAVYLCSGPGDLRRPDDLRGAILRYNASDSYVRLVTAIADAYRLGVRALPASNLTPVTSPALTSLTSTPATNAANPASGPASTKATGSTPALTPKAPALTQPVQPKPAQPTPTSTSSPSSITAPTSTGSPTSTASPTSPGSPCVPTASPSTAPPTSTTPATTAPACLPPCTPTPSAISTVSPTSTGSATTGQPCLPIPCLPAPAPTVTCTTPASTP